MKNDPFSEVKASFRKIYQAVERLSDDEILNGEEDRFRPYLDRLNQMVAMDVEDNLVQALLKDNDLKEMIGPIARVKRLHSIRMEIRQALNVIQSADPWEALARFVYYPNYLKLAQMECTGADLNPGDKVVFIGSGPLPLSLILLCKHHNIYGIGLEKNRQYMTLARDLIDALGLFPRIRIIHGDHNLLPLKTECRLVMVGAEALPKEEIFNHLARVLPQKAKLSYRIFEKGLRRLLDDQSAFVLPSAFTEYVRMRPEPPVNNTVVLLIKESPS